MKRYDRNTLICYPSIKKDSDDFTSLDENNTPETGNYSIEFINDDYDKIIVKSDDFIDQDTYTLYYGLRPF